jgi:hypothetical protein
LSVIYSFVSKDEAAVIFDKDISAHGVLFPSNQRHAALVLFIRLPIRLVNRVYKGRVNYFACYSQAHQKRIKKRISCASTCCARIYLTAHQKMFKKPEVF